MMGDHRTNPNAIAKAARVAIPAGSEFYDFQFKTVVEPNKDFMDEITRASDAAELAGEDPRRALHEVTSRWNPKDNPERYDYVVYRYAIVARPSALIPDRRQIPAATILLGQQERMPLVELRKRADDAFNGHEASERPNLQ